mmetsp:Transcript_19069/g.29494  ORF Transcript_19069/g.29494 Transcript_19069/m.29494 type:complete len:141 (+) Transcript_19069:221-643(+)
MAADPPGLLSERGDAERAVSVGSGETIAQLETAGWRLEVEAAELWEEAHAEHHAARDGGDDREVHEEGVTVLEQQRLILTVAQDRERMQRLVACVAQALLDLSRAARLEDDFVDVLDKHDGNCGPNDQIHRLRREDEKNA